jgi:threonine aldolase
MPLSVEERKLLRKSCTDRVHGFEDPDPAILFRQMADWSQATGVEHDVYGEGPLISGFESKVAQLLGKEAAAFMPSGVMAQLAALRIWTERAGLQRFALHASSHLENHEEQAYQALLGLHGVRVGEMHRPLLARDLAKVAEPLGCFLVELPMRELGGLLPTWDELEELKSAARERGVALHMDGARLWESRAFYGRTFAEIAAGFDSVYVSVYKGIGAIAGALLAGSAEFVGNARLWRRRMGGTLIHLSPLIASAAMQFDQRLALMDACYARTIALAETLNRIPGVRTLPGVPQVNMLHVFFDAPMEALLEARDQMAQKTGCWLLGHAGRADVPGWSRTELYIGDCALRLSDEKLAPLFEELMSIAGR